MESLPATHRSPVVIYVTSRFRSPSVALEQAGQVVVSVFHRWANSGSETLSDLPKVTQLLNARGKTKTLIIHVHPLILAYCLELKDRPMGSLIVPSFFQCRR